MKKSIFLALAICLSVPGLAFAKKGGICSSSVITFAQPENVEFYCKDLGDKPLTISQIYQKGWRVVSVVAPDTKTTAYNTLGLVIEEQ